MEEAEKSCQMAAKVIREAAMVRPRSAIVLGSGLGGFAEKLEGCVRLSYTGIPHFPRSTAPSHEGKLYIGRLNGQPVYIFSGRWHFYEGFSFRRITFFVRVLKMLGVQNLVLTNAAGLINCQFSPGDFMLIRDHINLSGQSPCRGRNLAFAGERFFDMSNTYDHGLRETARRIATENEFPLHEGVYAFMAGPQYETPAEVRMLSLLGADAVGMSTVPEAIEAMHCGLHTLGISCLTNYAAGLSTKKLTGEEVTKTADAKTEELFQFLSTLITRI
ncbi:MAG TPA: purine-nucleoside phosphorylase [Ruminococcaceae bacterium]|nr:purine-nucleoside phosphorylase [Oscillospiraceae bacterium]